MYISYVIMEEMVAKGGLKQRAKETAGEKDWSRKPKKETDVSDAETKKRKGRTVRNHLLLPVLARALIRRTLGGVV